MKKRDIDKQPLFSMPRFLQAFSDLGTGCGGQCDLHSISWKIRENADGDAGCRRDAKLPDQPQSAEDIADECAKDQSQNFHETIAFPTLHECCGEDDLKKETDEISSCRTGDTADTAAESGKHRKACCSQKKISPEAQQAALKIQHIYKQVEGQIQKGKRHRRYRQRDCQWSQNTENRCHKGGKCHLLDR